MYSNIWNFLPYNFIRIHKKWNYCVDPYVLLLKLETFLLLSRSDCLGNEYHDDSFSTCSSLLRSRIACVPLVSVFVLVQSVSRGEKPDAYDMNVT